MALRCAGEGNGPPSAMATTSAATTRVLTSRSRATSLRGLPELPLASARHIGPIDWADPQPAYAGPEASSAKTLTLTIVKHYGELARAWP